MLKGCTQIVYKINEEILKNKGLSEITFKIKNCSFINKIRMILNNEIANIKGINEQNIILNYIKNNTKYNFATFNQFVKWLNDISYKIERKFNTNIPKIVYNKLHNIRYYDFSPNNKLLKSERIEA